MIKTLLKVSQEDIERLGRDAAFVAVLSKWEVLTWVKYLRKYGTIVKTDHYYDSDSHRADTYELCWELPAERETWFHLNYGKQKEHIKRLT